jgi:uncharacterized membrane protein
VLTGSASKEIDAPIERCWEVIEDVATAPQWQNNLISLEVLERDDHGRAVIADAVSDAKFKKVRTRQQFTYGEPTNLWWKMVEGDVDSMEGSWELQDLGGGRTKATYTLAVDPGPIGGVLLGPLERMARGMLVNGRAKELAKVVKARG